MATQTSLAMAGARVAGIPPVNVPGVLVNPPIRKKGFIGAISASGQSTGPLLSLSFELWRTSLNVRIPRHEIEKGLRAVYFVLRI